MNSVSKPAGLVEEGPWGAATTACCAVVVVALTACPGFLCLPILDYLRGDSATYSLPEVNLLLAGAELCGYLLGTLALLTLIKLRGTLRARDYLGVGRIGVRRVLLWATPASFVGLGTMAANAAGWIHIGSKVPTYSFVGIPMWLTLVLSLLAGPIYEEMLFRGFIYAGLASSRLRPAGAIALTAAAWTALHTPEDVIWGATLAGVGLLLGFSRMKTGSIISAIVAHSAINTWTMLRLVL
jgi:membrane protease YdiL (CAAX protease family)